MAEDLLLIDQETANQLRRLLRKVDNARGEGVRNTPDSLTIGQNKNSAAKPLRPDPLRIINLTGQVSGQAGRYTVDVYRWSETAPSGNLTASDLTLISEDAEFENLNEVGNTSHDHDPSSETVWAIGIEAGRKSDGTPIIVGFTGGGGGGGSSETIGTTQYQVHQMVSNSEAGWDYGRFP